MTFSTALMVTLHAPVPEHAPPQPLNTDPEAGAAAKLTTVPELYWKEHAAPQLIPAGELVTVPLPVPIFVTDNWNNGTKVAVTMVAEFTVTLQVPVPVQAPPQPVNAIPASGAAVRITGVPAVNENEHVAPQLIPAGLLVTVPVPVPNFETVSASCGVKVAVTL